MRRIKENFHRLRKRISGIPFFSTNYHFGSNVMLKLLAAPVRSKVSALTMGPRGMGRFGTVQNYQMLAHSVGSLGLGSGLTAEISRRVLKEDQAGIDGALRVSFTALCAASIFSTLCLLASLHWFAVNFLHDPIYIKLLISPILALPFYCFGACYLEPILYGHSLQAIGAKAYKFAAITDLLSFLVLVYFYNLTGASFSIFCASVVHFLTLLVLVRRHCPKTALFRFGFHVDIFRGFLKTGISLLLVGASLYGVNLAIRAIISRSIGDTENGIYQVTLALSAFYTPFITAATWTRLYPQVGGHGLNDKVLLEFTEALVYSAVFASLAQCFILVAPRLIIHALWSGAFVPAAGLLPLRFIGDYGFLLAQPVLGVLLGLQARRAFLSLYIGAQVLLALLSVLLKGHGLYGLVAAYAAANLILLGVCLTWYFRQLNKNVTLSGLRFRILGLLLLPLVSVCFQAALSQNDNLRPARVFLFALTSVGFYFAVKCRGMKEILALRATAVQG